MLLSRLHERHGRLLSWQLLSGWLALWSLTTLMAAVVISGPMGDPAQGAVLAGFGAHALPGHHIGRSWMM